MSVAGYSFLCIDFFTLAGGAGYFADTAGSEDDATAECAVGGDPFVGFELSSDLDEDTLAKRFEAGEVAVSAPLFHGDERGFGDDLAREAVNTSAADGEGEARHAGVGKGGDLRFGGHEAYYVGRIVGAEGVDCVHTVVDAKKLLFFNLPKSRLLPYIFKPPFGEGCRSVFSANLNGRD